jgi:hypothetical protein
VPFISIVDVFDALGIMARACAWVRSRLQTNLPHDEVAVGWLWPTKPLRDDWEGCWENSWAIEFLRVLDSSNSPPVKEALSQDVKRPVSGCCGVYGVNEDISVIKVLIESP